MSSGFDPTFTPSGGGHRGGSVPDPGGTAGTSHFLREDATWALTTPTTPPPAPGPGLDQWACNAAGFILYEVIYKLVKTGVDSGFFSDILKGAVAFVFDALDAILPEGIIIDAAFLSWLEGWLTSQVQAYASTILAHLLDQPLWDALHCYLYSAIQASPSDLQAALVAAATAINTSGLTPAALINAVVLILQKLGTYSIGPIPLDGFVQQYDCSSCASGHTVAGPGVVGVDANLLVDDTVTFVPFVQEIEFVGAVVSGTSPKAVVTVSSGASQSGVVGIPVLAGQASASAPVTFSPALGVPPTILVASSDENFIASYENVTTIGCTLRATARFPLLAGVTVYVSWAIAGGGPPGPAGPAGSGSSVIVSDGTTTVTGATELVFTGGAAVSNAGGGVANIAAGGGGSSLPWLAFTTPPDMSGWTWFNQGSATIAPSSIGQVFSTPGHSGDNIIALTTTPPATPWTLTACLNMLSLGFDYQFGGIVLRDATGNRTITYGLALQDSIKGGALKWTGTSSYQGDYNRFFLGDSRLIWVRVHNDGTNFTFYYSPDNVNWLLYATKSVTDFLTALTGVGIGIDNNTGSTPVLFTVLSWAFS